MPRRRRYWKSIRYDPIRRVKLVEKIIHQTWADENIPAPYDGFVKTLRLKNPDYQYRFWTDKDLRNLIKQHYPWFLETFDTYKHQIERVDAARYFILHKYGGVYIDLDMECLKPIRHLFKNAEIFFSLEAGPAIEDQVISNAFMAAPSQHQFFEDLIHSLRSIRKKDITFQDVFNNTGPNMLHRFIKESIGKYAIRIIKLEDICPRAVINQLEGLERASIDEIRAAKNLTLIHHNTESWNVQHPTPLDAPAGYTLYVHRDIIGFDIDYVNASEQWLNEIVEKCSANVNAMGFNYNGFIKSAGGALSDMSVENKWLKADKAAWICIKNEYLENL